MKERRTNVKMHGQPIVLLGDELSVGDEAPSFSVVDQNLHLVNFSKYDKKTTLLLTVPSLDTSVCSMETRRFNEGVSKFGDRLRTIIVSMDLPFAQKRWCGAEGIKNVLVYSDYQRHEVGKNYGTLIKDLNLLTRAIFIIDQEGIVQFIHFVEEVTQEPDYEQIYREVQKVIR